MVLGMSGELIGIGIVGYGYWGPNLVRNFASSESAHVIGVSDLDRSEAGHLQAPPPRDINDSDFQDLLRNPADRRDRDRNACSDSLMSLAHAALNAGKHVLVEKPLAPDVRSSASPHRRGRPARI